MIKCLSFAVYHQMIPYIIENYKNKIKSKVIKVNKYQTCMFDISCIHEESDGSIYNFPRNSYLIYLFLY